MSERRLPLRLVSNEFAGVSDDAILAELRANWLELGAAQNRILELRERSAELMAEADRRGMAGGE